MQSFNIKNLHIPKCIQILLLFEEHMQAKYYSIDVEGFTCYRSFVGFIIVFVCWIS